MLAHGPDPSGNTCVTSFGDLGRNIYHGPFQQNWDVSFLKHFKIGERQDLRFAADFFNIWNHTNFANPTVTDIEAYFAEQPVWKNRTNDRQSTADPVLAAVGFLELQNVSGPGGGGPPDFFWIVSSEAIVFLRHQSN